MDILFFYRGLKEKYNPDLHKNGIYFSTDTLEVLINGKSYGGGLTKVEYDGGTITFEFANDSTLEITIPEATQSNSGLLSASDKKKIDELPTGQEITEDFEEVNQKMGDNNYEGSNYINEQTNLTNAIIALDTALKQTNDTASALDKIVVKEIQLDGVKLNLSNGVVNIPLASESQDGLMSQEDKTRLNKVIDTGEGTKYLTDNGTYKALDKNSVGLGNVDNTADLAKPISTATQSALDGKVDKSEGKSLVADTLITKLEQLDDKATIDAAIADKIPLSQKGVASGVATLDENGKVPAAQLPVYVDDVLEGTLSNTTTFQLAEGQQGGVQLPNVIYVDTATNKSYRWSGTQYVTIASDLALGETSSTAYAGDKGKQVTDRVTKVYGANSVINGLSDVTFDSDDTEAQTLSADNALKTWDGSGTPHDMKIPYATTSKAGVMSAADKTKVNGALQTANAGVGVLASYSIAGSKSAISQSDTINQAVGKLEKALNDLAGDGDGSVPDQIQEAIDTLVGGASEEYQTLKELEDAIKNNDSELTTLEARVTTHINNKDNPHQVTKAQIGLSNVDDTSDVNKPISTATQTALNNKVDKTTTVNGHALSGNVTVTKDDVGLGNVDNTPDDNKPVSTAQQAAIDSAKSTIDAYTVNGKTISTNPTVNAEDIPITDTPGYFNSTNVEDALKEIKQPLDTHLQNNTPGMEHIPSGGTANQILAWSADGAAKWENLSNIEGPTEDILAYGVEWNTTVSDPQLIRIGNMSLHKTLPIQSQLKGCIAQGGKIIYWLDENDWRWRKTPIYIGGVSIETETITLHVRNGYTAQEYANRMKGAYIRGYNDPSDPNHGKLNVIRLDSINTINEEDKLVNFDYTKIIDNGNHCSNWEEGAVLNGYDGTVRVYCPEFYIKSQSIGDIRRVWISAIKIDSTYHYQQPVLVDAYRCTVLNTVPENMGYLSTLSANTAVSIANTSNYCRGGNHNIIYDQYLEQDPFRTQLGKPRTNLNRPTMRKNASQAGAHLLSYEEYKNIFYWLYVVEYANFNSQAEFSSSLDDNGYEQGGLGSGVTTINRNVWDVYNSFYPITPCGYLDSLGNGSGIKHQVLKEFSLQVTPTKEWTSWTNSVYSNNGINYQKVDVQKSGGTLTITNIHRQGQILYTAAKVAAGKATYTISGLQKGQQITFACDSQVIQTVSSNCEITVDWGIDGATTRNINALFTGECNIIITCNNVEESTLIRLSQQTITVNRWRGFDNPFGDTFTNLDGIIIDADTNNHSDNVDYVYTCNDPSKFGDKLTDDYVKTAESIHQNGFIKAFDLGETANTIVSQVGGSETSFMCDYLFVGENNNDLRTVIVGGIAHDRMSSGLGYIHYGNVVDYHSPSVGYRSVSVLGS